MRLDFWQRDLLAAAFTPGLRSTHLGHSQIAVKGATKVGKGAVCGILVNLWWYIYDPCKIILTGPNVKHTREGIFAEACTWHRLITEKRQTEVQAENWRWPKDEQKLVTIGNAETGEGFSGKHGPHTLFAFDEASSLADKFYHQAITQAAVIYAASNPRVNTGWFRGLYPAANSEPGPDVTRSVEIPSGKRYLCTVDAVECVNVKSGLQLIPAQVSREILADVLDPTNKPDWWPDCMGHGKFPREDAETQLFLPKWLPPCVKKWHELKGGTPESQIRVCGFGLDVGASTSGDPTVLAAAGIEGIDRFFERPDSSDTMQTVEWVILMVRACYGIDLTTRALPVVVDLQGVGKGVYDRLRERSVNALPSNKHENKLIYGNARAENYGELARRIDPNGAWAIHTDEDGTQRGSVFALPDDKDLHIQLLAHDKIYKSSGAFILTPKDKQPGTDGETRVETIRQKIGRSPDKSDAAAYACRAILDMAKLQIPTIKREIMVATSADAAQLDRDKGIDPHTGKKLIAQTFDQAAAACNKPTAYDLEDIGVLATRTVEQMNAEDDERYW